jgi:hypothetical protein
MSINNNEGIFIYHYFEKERGPFLSLSDLSDEKISQILERSRKEDKESGKGTLLGSVYSDENINVRRCQEYMTRVTFAEKGGVPVRKFPYYAVLARGGDPTYIDALNGRYKNGAYLRINVDDFDMSAVSFTYGDQCECINPAEYENFIANTYRPPVYTYDEIFDVIAERGWIPYTGDDGWPRPWYVEAQIWNDDSYLEKYKKLYT